MLSDTSTFKVEANGCTDDALVAFGVLCELTWTWSRRNNLLIIRSDVQSAFKLVGWVCNATRVLNTG